MAVIWWYIIALRPTRLWSLRQSCEIDWFRVAVSGRLEAQLAPFGHAISRYLGLRGRKFLSLLVVSLLFVRFLLSAHPAVSLFPSPVSRSSRLLPTRSTIQSRRFMFASCL